jgi:hypothetical protein
MSGCCTVIKHGLSGDSKHYVELTCAFSVFESEIALRSERQMAYLHWRWDACCVNRNMGKGMHWDLGDL